MVRWHVLMLLAVGVAPACIGHAVAVDGGEGAPDSGGVSGDGGPTDSGSVSRDAGVTDAGARADSGSTADAGPTSDTLPKGLGWHELSADSGTQISAIDATGDGETVTADWSSAVMDQARHRLIVTGGGHGDCDNGLYAIQLDGNPPYAFTLSASSATPGVQGATQYPDGSPQTGHTYDGIVFIPPGPSPLADSYFQVTQAPVCPGDGESNWALALPMANVTIGQPTPGAEWKFLAKGPSGLDEGEGTTADFDPSTGLVFLTAPRFSSLFAFDPATSTFTALTPQTTGCDFYCTSSVDADHRRLYAFGGNNNGGTAWTWWDIDGGIHATAAETDFATPPGCPTLNGGPGVDWDPINHTFVLWNSSGAPSTNQLYTYNPGSAAAPDGTPAGACQALNPPGSAPPDAHSSNGTYKRFRYSSYCDCFVLLNDATQNAFIVRTR
jgi:hypothetical protein